MRPLAPRGHRVALLASSDYDELERALRLLRVIPMMRKTRILLFPPARGTKPACAPDEVKKHLGAEVVAIQQKQFDELIAAVDQKAVRARSKRGPTVPRRSWNQSRKTSTRRPG